MRGFPLLKLGAPEINQSRHGASHTLQEVVEMAFKLNRVIW
jgi:hypothetical protein